MTAGAKEYGTALYELAKEENIEQEVLDGLQVVCDVFNANPMYAKILQNPAVDKSERLNMLEEALKGNVNTYVMNFCKILCEKKAVFIVHECLDIFRDLLYNAKGIMPVTAVTAVEMTKPQQDKLIEKLQKTTGKTILLETQIDAKVIGGVKLIYSGKEINGTTSSRLESLRNALTL